MLIISSLSPAVLQQEQVDRRAVQVPSPLSLAVLQLGARASFFKQRYRNTLSLAVLQLVYRRTAAVKPALSLAVLQPGR